MRGVVKRFSNEKGFGFITADEKDYFVHYSQIVSTGYKTLSEGDKVSFDVKPTDKGPQAINVVKVK